MRDRMQTLMAAATAVLLIGLAGTAGAGAEGAARLSPVVGSDFRVTGARATADEDEAAVAWNKEASQYLVVWGDARNEATRGKDIYGRLLDEDGTPSGSDFRISGHRATADEWWPAVAWNSRVDEYLVVWTDFRSDATRGSQVYGRRVAADGTRVGSDFRISGLGATEDEGNPKVVWSGTDEYLVVWRDGRDRPTRGEDIYGRRVSAAGVPLAADFRISGPGADDYDTAPAVAWNGRSLEYLVVWTDQRDEATRGWDIYGRRVSAAGVPLAADFRISGPAATGQEDWASVAWNNTANQYLVVWQDGRNPDPRNMGIYGQRVSAAGAAVGGDFLVSSAAATKASWGAVVAWSSTADRYLVAWADYRDGATRQNDVYGRRVTSTGAMPEDDFRISGRSATADEAWPEVVWNVRADEYLVVWTDGRNDAWRGFDIYGRRVAG